MGFGKKLTALVLAAAMTAAACSCGTESGKSTAGEESSQAEEKPDFRTEMRDDMTTGDIVAEMGLGINLGNTLEACGDWIDSSGGVNSYETAWGSPTVTEEMIAGYAAAGFDSVRIPVAWSNLMGDDYTGTVRPCGNGGTVCAGQRHVCGGESPLGQRLDRRILHRL